jgi:carbonic anhydrase
MTEATVDRRRALAVVGGLMLSPLCAIESFSAETHWNYEGATGPDKWGDLDPANKVCNLGSQESPLDIVAPIKAQLSPLQIAWAKQGDTIVNNGHTIQVNCAPGSTLTVGVDKYASFPPSERAYD